MKKLFAIVLCFSLVFAFSMGCALVQRPTGDLVADTELAIEQADIAVSLAQGVFEGLCEEAVFGPNDCQVGNAALNLYNTDKEALKKLLADYQAGKIDGPTLQASSKAFTKNLITILRSLRAGSKMQVEQNKGTLKKIRAMKMNKDLNLPSGQIKK